MKKILGIIGGGQLGMMLTEAAKNMPEHISDVIVLDPTENCPAAKVGAKQIVADYSDKNAIVELSSQTDIITYEIESGNADVLQSIKNTVSINPSPDTLRIIQDKYLQKKFLHENQIPVTEFTDVNSISGIEEKIKSFGYPAMLKLRRNAYDGRGNFRIENKNQIRNGFEKFNGKPIMLEKNVNFLKEISVIAARNTEGDIIAYDPVENIHEENILRMTIAPARISTKAAQEAKQIAEKVMDVFHGAGVFGIEMFVIENDKVLINEIAPRVHNSGHHTLQSCHTSQFEQHLRAILGLKLGNSKLRHDAVMYNILGPKNITGKCKSVNLQQMEGMYLKWYQKDEIKPLRKMGHFNVIDIHDTHNIENLITKATEIGNSITFVMNS